VPPLLGVLRGTGTIGFGARGDAVSQIQGMLKEAKLTTADEKGFFGRETEKAVLALQRQSNLAPTGQIDLATYGALQARVEAGRRPAPREPSTGPTTTVRFEAGYRHSADARLVAGGKLTLDYDISRLSNLRHTHNGFPAWGIDGYVKIFPGGEVIRGSVMQFETHRGIPTNTPLPKPFTVDIPKDATRVEVWFRNWTGADRPAEAYDSQYGRNYSFNVVQPR
jgi:hypothetical protein